MWKRTKSQNARLQQALPAIRSAREPCKNCGHAACKKNCEILGDNKYLEIEQGDADRFTPKAREIWLGKRKEASKTPSTGKLSTSTHLTSAPSTSGAAALGSISTLTTSLATTSISDEDLFAGMTERQKQKALEQRRWDQELPNMTKAPTRRSERPTGNMRSSELFSTIKANFFKLGFNPSIKLYRYSISLGCIEIPSEDNGEPRRFLPTNRDTKRYLINSMLLQPDSNPSPVSGVVWASDFDSTIVSAGELYPGLNVASPTQVVRHARTGQNGSTPPVMESQVRYLGILTIDDLIKHCSSPCKSAADYLPNEDLKALNIISWKNINSDLFQGGRRGNKFYPESLLDPVQEDGKNGRLYMIRTGFFSSVRPGEDSVLLNVNTTTSAFYSPILLSKWIELERNGRLFDRSDLQNKLKGVKVVFTAEALDRQRKRAVFDISGRQLSETYFTRDKNQTDKTSVLTYMKTKYPVHAQHFRSNDYCINLGSWSDKRWYPAEFLKIVDWQPVTKVLKGGYAEEMIDIAKTNPQKNQSKILDHALPLLGLKGQHTRFYQDFGITFDARPRFIQIDPLFCRAPWLRFNSSDKNVLVVPEQAAWNLKSQFLDSKLSKTKQNRLGVLWLFEKIPEGITLKLLESTMKTLGMGGEENLEFVHAARRPPAFNPLASNSTSPNLSAPSPIKTKYRVECQKVFRQGLDMLNQKGKVLLVIVVLPKQDKDLYAEIKRWGDCVEGIPTSCITFDKLQNCETMHKVCANFALKINFKLKGVSHHVNTPRCGADESTMIIGADVTHPSPENAAKGCPSIAAVVATNDDINNLYLGSARLQKGKQEFIEDLEGMIYERLAAWYRKHKTMVAIKAENKLPANIIFYRDGVSESQYGMVRSEEMPQIKAACKKIYPLVKRAEILLNMRAYKPKITIIVVTKRHHTRFYPNYEWETANIDPGLIIDTDVVTPNQFSFYLQSHCSPIGTARSSHYVVLEDGQNFRENPSKLQEITNNICYVSARATQALSVCTPARYADILCDRLRCYLKPSMDRRDTHRPANVPDQAAEAFDSDGDYSQMYGDDEFVWKCPVGEATRKNPWHESMNDVMFYL
ncbi:hypothetical protein EYC80_008261 [Monilinia laxa]|uniref:Piwi domain-containing protein n=1 Tax=Monilinia laxa TaxID=61186 RepID=A0A5N6JU06_MONLA|nr:hypothetical protein EYC80_008261 [Monilinia laxa]